MEITLNSPGMIIKKGSEKAFFSKLKETQPTKEFWDDCKNIRKNITPQSLAELNSLMDRKD